LQTLRDSGKKLFLATNSHTEYADMIMTITLGEDWKSFFDILCFYCKKPIFFLESKSTPFYEIDETKCDLKGKTIHKAEELKLNGEYT
jgi:5' nucleotidase family